MWPWLASCPLKRTLLEEGPHTSVASSKPAIAHFARSVDSHPASSAAAAASLTAASDARTATEAFAQIPRARRTASVRASPARTRTLTKPAAQARDAQTDSRVRISSRARFSGSVARGTARARGDRSACHLRETEDGSIRGDDEIAREHDLEPTTQRRPVRSSNERLGPVASDDPVPTAAFGEVVTARGKITAGAEDRSCRGENPGPQIVVFVEQGQCSIDLVGECPVGRVTL